MFSREFEDGVRLALLCDYALTSEDGKVSALGLFSNMSFASLPANYPRFFVVIVAALHPGHHEATITLLGPTGAEIIPNGPAMTLDVPEGSNETNLIIGFDNITFESPGLHQLQMRLDGKVAITLPFAVVQPQAQGFTARGNA